MIRVAVVGCGMAARRIHLPGMRATERFDVVAFASRSRASAEATRDEWGGGRVEDDWADAVAADDVDAVLVATPNAFHAEVTIAAAGAGKHVLVEKPMATRVADADAMIAAAADVVLMPTQTLRVAPPFLAAARAVAGGMVGEVTGARVAFGHGGPQHWAPDSTWFCDVAVSGGGALIDLGVHAADLIRAVVGDEVERVGAVLRPGPDGVEEAGQVVVHFAGGAVGSLHASWVALPAPDHQLSIFGTAGLLHLDSRTPLTFHPADGDEPERVPNPPREERIDLYTAFADAVEHGARLPVTAADGRAAVAIVTAAYESDATGQIVTLA